MAFETGITIKQALENIQAKKYAMPAIQREFVWSTEQIERLFDSLMQGYPIGAFLFWEVEPETVPQYKWYDFVINYHAKNNPHCPPFTPLDNRSGLTAILDGQQRLTALNIGLRGSYAEKLPKLWWNNPDAYPEKHLYLNINSELEDDELGMRYQFRFLTEVEFEAEGGTQNWFKVADMMAMEDAVAPTHYLLDHGLFNTASEHVDQTEARDRLNRLTQLRYMVHVDRPVSFFLEREQDLDKVLNIFIRTNSGGTVLSNSDLLLSIATANWTELDARQEVHERVDELNQIGDGFSFPQDFMLKAGLVLADLPDVKFRVANFNSENMERLEKEWRRIAQSLRITVDLAHQFGLSGGRLPSQNSLLPIAYYLHRRAVGPEFLSAVRYREERDAIKGWLMRTLLKRVWGGANDSLLTRLRAVIAEQGQDGFPVAGLSRLLTEVSRSLAFDDEELDDVVDTEYGSSAFVLLSLLYPNVNVANEKFHMDHVFPRSKFSRPALHRAGLTHEEGTKVRERMNRLGNLQLMSGPENMSKQDVMPMEWIKGQEWNDRVRNGYIEQHDLGDVPEDVRGFVDWYDARREKMLQRLKGILATSRIP